MKFLEEAFSSPLLFVFAKFATTIMKGIVEGDYMKNLFYGIMDLFTIGFYGWMICYIIINFTNVAWNLPSVMMMITVVWTTVRFVKMHVYILGFTNKNSRKVIMKVINR